jgi:hypothetical protein
MDLLKMDYSFGAYLNEGFQAAKKGAEYCNGVGPEIISWMRQTG